jgi:carbamoyl-phosphate synthase large subunit
MTDPVTADHVYLLPLNTDSLVKILEESASGGYKKKIDAVLPTMGGQTALNLCKEADEMGIWKKYGVKIIGVNIDAIETTENREAFRALMKKIGIGVPESKCQLFPGRKRNCTADWSPSCHPPFLHAGRNRRKHGAEERRF